jgi:hypothetical protein
MNGNETQAEQFKGKLMQVLTAAEQFEIEEREALEKIERENEE